MSPTAKQVAKRWSELQGPGPPRLTNAEAAREKYAAGVLTLEGLCRALDYWFEYDLADAPAPRDGSIWSAAAWASWNPST